MPLHVLIHLMLLQAPAPDVDARIADLIVSADAHHDAEEYAAAARDYLTLASLPRADGETALKKAHLNLDAAFVKTGEVLHLCRALALGHRRLTAGQFKTDQARLSWEETVADDERRLADAGGHERCPTATAPSRALMLLDADEPATTPPREGPVALASTRVEPSSSRQLDLVARKLRARTIAGATLTGMGLGFAGLTGLTITVHALQVAALRRANAVPDGYTYSARDEKMLTSLHNDALLTKAASIGLGVVSAAILGTGIGLLASRRRASRAMALAPHGGPQGGGLTLRLRF